MAEHGQCYVLQGDAHQLAVAGQPSVPFRRKKADRRHIARDAVPGRQQMVHRARKTVGPVTNGNPVCGLTV